MKEIAPPQPPDRLGPVALGLLRGHRARAPRHNPVRAFRAALEARAGALVGRPLSVFHAYAFNTTRQLGANFELLGSHLAWLGEAGAGDFAEAAEAATRLAGEAKAFQFQLARAFHRRSAEGLGSRLDAAVASYEAVFAALDRALDRSMDRPRGSAPA